MTPVSRSYVPEPSLCVCEQRPASSVVRFEDGVSFAVCDSCAPPDCPPLPPAAESIDLTRELVTT